MVQGKAVAQIARDEGVSRATASKLGNSREVQLLITALVEAQGAKIRELFDLALEAVRDSFSAMGQGENAGSKDHYARLTGVKCLTALLTAGRSAQKPEPPAKRTFTVEELERVLAAAHTTAVQ
jgi:hypothetical protein